MPCTMDVRLDSRRCRRRRANSQTDFFQTATQRLLQNKNNLA